MPGKPKVKATDGLITKFLDKVEFIPFHPCWEWVGARKSKNIRSHGHFSLGGGDTIVASRMSYILFKGPIPKKLYVCHTCDNPPCVNPHHLFLGTQKDNMQDCLRKGRFRTRLKLKTECVFGHEFTDENSYIAPGQTSRRCKICIQRRDKCHKEKKKKLMVSHQK